MISEDEWIYKAERRITMARDETVKQLEYEANALWKGKRVCGETVLGTPPDSIDALVHRVAVDYYADSDDGAYVSIAFYVRVASPEGEVEMYVYNPRFPDAETP